jgi:NADH dehydrogenase/NADH:ubiquinone oxidoreductase subunit G
MNEEISVFKIEKKKAALFEDYIKKYYNKDNETFIEKMFQFHESKIKIDKKQFSNNLKIKKIEFESFLNMDLFFPYENKQRYNIYDLLKNKYSNLSVLGNELPKINNTKNNKYIEKFLNLFRDNNNENEFYNNTNEIKTNKNCILKRIYSLPNILNITINRMIIGKPFNKSKLIIQENIDLKEYLDENIDEGNIFMDIFIIKLKPFIINFYI